MTRPRRYLFLFLFLGMFSIGKAAAPPTKPPARSFDFSKLPPGTIFIVGDEAKDALQQPGVVILSPEKFKELIGQLEQFKRQANPEKGEFRGSCKMSGRVEGALVHLKVQFEFATRRGKEIVPIGCQKAWPTAVSLDDNRLPLFQTAGDDGFTVQVETPGPHRLTVDLDLPVTARASGKVHDRGFELGLPRAAITLLESLDVTGVGELRIGNRTLPARLLHSRDTQRKLLALGPIDRLEVSWKGPVPMQRTTPILTSKGQMDVRVDDAYVTTEAELILEVPNASPVAQWQVQAPPPPLVNMEADAQVIPPPMDARVPLWTLKLKEPSAEPLKVRIRQRQPRGRIIAIGPFAVPGALRQHGKITINTPTDLRPRYRTRGEVTQVDAPQDVGRGPGNEAVFSYWSLPPVGPNQPVPAPVEVELQTIEGGVETALTHRLDLREEGWQVSTELDVTPVRTSLERLELDLPNDFDFKAGPAIRVKPELDILKEPGTPNRIGVLELAQKQHNHFKLDLSGLRPVPAGAETAIVTLPRPRKTLDRGAKVTVTVPDGMELLAARSIGVETLPAGTRKWTWDAAQAPPRVELSWRRLRRDLAVDGLVDAVIGERQVSVRQSLRLQATEPLREIILRARDFPAGRTPIGEGVTLTPRGANRWVVSGHPTQLTLNYAVPLPAPGQALKVPIFWLERATRCAMKVRVWSDPGVQPVPAAGPWDEQPTEMVPERESLPSLVLRSGGVPRESGLEFPLALKLTRPVGNGLATLAVHHQLIRASVGESGQQSYRVRYLFSKLGSHWIDVELPGSPAALGLEAFFEGKPVPVRAIDEEGREKDTGRIARLRVEPELYRQRAMLDLRYQIAPGKAEGGGRMQTTFYPPRLRDNIVPGEVRWQVALPPEWIVLHAGGQATVQQRLGFRSGLPAPRPAWTTAELERWITGPDPRAAAPDPLADPTPRSPELTCWQPAAAPLAVVYLPQQTWLLGCSLTFLAIGLALSFAPLPRGVFWSALGCIAFAALAATISWPGTLTVVLYGCAFGLIVLPVAIGIHWLLQRRYRRKVVFMPGFSRLAPGSSIVQPGSSLRRRGEPSTVDAPPGAAP